MKLRKHVCNFCGRNEDQVTHMVAGPDVDICDGCIAVASEIVAEANANATKETP
jgi:ATP-dependent Clp protease ATP-binding subunit ClpX